MEMTKGSLGKQILFFSLPLVMTNLLQMLFNIADVSIAGRFAGATALGAVGSTTILVSLTTGWLIGMSNGVNAVVAFFSGAQDREHEHTAVQNGLLLYLAAGLLTGALGITLAEPVLKLLGTKDELIGGAACYFRIYMAGSPALAIFNFGSGVLSAEGNTKQPLKYLSIAGAINVVLNLYFVICLHMTADGVAYASIISQYISAFLIMRAMLRTRESYRPDLRHLNLDRSIALRILRIGLPAALQYSLFSIASLFFQSAVNSFDPIVVEGNSAAMSVDSLVYRIIEAFYAATTSFMAQNYGAGNRERVRNTYLITTAYSCGIALVLGALVYIFRGQVLYVFTSEADVVAAGSIRLSILAFCYALSVLMDNAAAACRGLGKAFIPTIIVMLGSIGFRILWIFTVFAHYRTLQSLYLMYAFAFILTAIPQNIYYFRLYRKTFSNRP